MRRGRRVPRRLLRAQICPRRLGMRSRVRLRDAGRGRMLGRASMHAHRSSDLQFCARARRDALRTEQRPARSREWLLPDGSVRAMRERPRLPKQPRLPCRRLRELGCQRAVHEEFGVPEQPMRVYRHALPDATVCERRLRVQLQRQRGVRHPARRRGTRSRRLRAHRRALPFGVMCGHRAIGLFLDRRLHRRQLRLRGCGVFPTGVRAIALPLRLLDRQRLRPPQLGRRSTGRV